MIDYVCGLNFLVTTMTGFCYTLNHLNIRLLFCRWSCSPSVCISHAIDL